MTESLWQRETAAERALFPALAGDREVDVLVVGAGLAGLGAARALRARGRTPFVIDRAGPGAGASAKNAGFVLVTHASGYPSLRRRVGVATARALLDAARRSHEIVRSVLSEPAAYRQRGSLVLSMEADEEEAAALEEARTVLGVDGAGATFVDVPSGLAGFARALLVAGDAEVHPGRLLAALARGQDGAIARVRRLDPGTRIAETEEGPELAYRDVVVATNAWAAELAPELASLVTPQRGQVLATEPVPRALAHVCYAGWGYDYFRQREDGRVILGGRRGLFLDAEQTAADVPSAPVQEALDAYLATHLPFARGAKITDRWAGTMAFTPDLLPLVGALPDRAGAWVIAGFSGHGLGLALACGELLADCMHGERSAERDVLAACLAPHRFASTGG